MKYALAFSDINPQAPIHTLVIPKNPYINFYDFTKNASTMKLNFFGNLLMMLLIILNLNIKVLDYNKFRK